MGEGCYVILCSGCEVLHFFSPVTGTGLNELQIAFVCREVLSVSTKRGLAVAK